jgi:hypothetical protein
MRIFARAFVSTVLILFSFHVAAAAQGPGTASDNVFVVPQVPVQASAGSASEAQRIARNQGRKQAMDILLRRLTAEEDWVYLPRLAIGQPASAGLPMSVEPNGGIGDGATGFEEQTTFSSYTGRSAVMLDESRLPTLEEGFFVFNEKSSQTSYSAQITYRFKPDEVRALLKRAGIPYSESQSRLALVIPILETENGVYLWESNNPWARAWLARPLVNELTPLLLPKGDEEDMEMLPARDARVNNQFRLQQMAERYGVTQVIVAHGFVSEKDEQFLLRVRLKESFLNTVARSANEYSAGNSAELYDGNSSRVGRTLAESFFRGRNDDFPALAARAVESIVTKYGAGWKAETLVDHSLTQTLTVNLWADSIEEVGQINGALTESPLVESFNSEAMAAGGGTLTIVIVGDVQQFKAELRQRNLVFWRSSNGSWNIAVPAKAAEVQITAPEVPDDYVFPSEGEFDGPVGQNYRPLNVNRGERQPSSGLLPDFSPLSDRERVGREPEEDGTGRGTILIPTEDAPQTDEEPEGQ